MALAGNLKDFGVPDILQLIMSQEKTGVLTIKSDAKVANIGFEKGQLVEAIYGGATRDRVLRDYFVKPGRISKEELQEILRHQAETGSSFEEILLKFGFVSEEELKEIVVFRIQEVLDILLTWKEGEYRFETDATIYPKGVVQVSVNPQAVMMEGMRRVDEWPRIRRVLSDPKIILAQKAKPILSMEFGPNEKKMLELVDGAMSLAQLQEMSGLGRFRTYQACFNLLEVGALEKKGLAVTKVVKRKRVSGAKIKVFTLSGAGWIFIVAFVIVNVVLGLYVRSMIGDKIKVTTTSSYPRTSATNDLKVLLDQFFLKKGYYPTSLEQLVGEFWTTPQAIAGFNYLRTDGGASYVLTPLATERTSIKLPF